jgi:hypothetical protein
VLVGGKEPVALCEWKRRRPRQRDEAHTAKLAVRLKPAVRPKPAAVRLLGVMEEIDMKEVEAHFGQFDKDSKSDVKEDVNAGDEDSEGDVNEDDVEQGGCEPFLVASHVSQDDLREYCEHSAYENSPFKLRFLELSDDGKLWIVELPTSPEHERMANQFAKALEGQAIGNFIDLLGSSTTNVNGQKEADKTYGPRRNLPNSVRAAEPSITFVVEVGRTQQWDSLRGRAFEWYHYPGIKYILLISVNAAESCVSYEFYDVSLHDLQQDAAGNEILPTHPDTAIQMFRYSARLTANGTSPHTITLNSRRLLGIPTNQPLPQGVPPHVAVHLRDVLDAVRPL